MDVAGVVKASNGVVTLTTSGAPSVALPDGAIAIDTTNSKLFFRSSSSWREVGLAGAPPTSFAVIDLQDPDLLTASNATLASVSAVTGMSTVTAVPSTTPIVYFNTGIARSVANTTRVYLSNVETLLFYVNEGGGGWGEQPDANEDFLVQYSGDGSSWTTLDTTTPASVTNNTWTLKTITVPAGAKTYAGVYLRYAQISASGNTFDTWAATSLVAKTGGGGGGLTVSETEPSPATEGDLWFKEGTGQTFVFYDSEWMEIGPPVVDSVLQRISAKGDIIVATSGNTVATLPVGTNDYFLVADSTQATGLNWKDLGATAAILKTAVDAKGDLLVGTASDTISRLAVGSNNSLLVAASGEATGLSWSTTLSGLTLTSPTINSATLTTPTINNAAENYPLLKSPEEVWSISATAATGTVNVDVLTAAAFYYTSNASANWTFNFRGDGSTTLDSLLSTGTSVTVAFAVTNGGTAYRPTAFQVDGSSVTPKWQGGSAPSAGNTNSIDIYVFSLVKTGTATFTVFASQTRFA